LLIDARSLPTNQILETDVCIIGAGAAGIAVAAELINAPFRVLLVESGGTEFRHRTQLLYRGENSGRPYPPLEFTKRRQFGGTTKTWFGRCRPLDEIDFEERSWLPHSGWPIVKKDLDPYYARAHVLCELGAYDYQAGQSDSIIESSGLETKVFRFSPPTDFGQTYLDNLHQAANLRLVLQANAIKIALDPEGRRVSSLECKTTAKNKFSIKAKIFILAASALEITRMLLVSNDVHANGIGNQYDLVGRYFMEHPHLFSGILADIPAGFPPQFLKLNYEAKQKNLGVVHALGIPESRMRKEKLLNGSMFLVSRPIYKTEDRYYSKDLADFLQVMDVLQHTTAPTLSAVKNMGRSLSHIPKISNTLLQMARHKIRPSSQYALRFQVETVPNPNSRVTLSNQKDALGINRIRLHWELSPQDLDSFHRLEELTHDGLKRMGAQVKKINHELESDGWPVSMLAGKHHMGTTRMHTDPHMGVVDENCLVHCVNNLYIAGSSVFPTSGMANPTLTIVALAIRLAERVKQVMAAGS